MKFIIVETEPFYLQAGEESIAAHNWASNFEMFPACDVVKAFVNHCGGDNWNVAVDIMDPGRRDIYPEGTRFYINEGPHTKEMAKRNLRKLCSTLNGEDSENERNRDFD